MPGQMILGCMPNQAQQSLYGVWQWHGESTVKKQMPYITPAIKSNKNALKVLYGQFITEKSRLHSPPKKR